MAGSFARGFYQSTAWRKCRASFIAGREAIDGGICERCQREPGYIVDHIIELTPDNILDPEVTLNHSNLQYLCLECHNIKTFSPDARYRLTPDGDVIPIAPLKK